VRLGAGQTAGDAAKKPTTHMPVATRCLKKALEAHHGIFWLIISPQLPAHLK